VGKLLATALVFLLAAPRILLAAYLHVGPGQEFTDLNAALAKAAPGDHILVFPLPDGRPYENVALLVRTPVSISCGAPNAVVRLSGTGFDYSGDGKVPRAIVQFDPGSDGSMLVGFDLSGAHNKSFNGAGVRINQANNITIANCAIHDNDMGIMSNGRLAATPPSGSNQAIAHCRIYHNGAIGDPGQNHNLYLGGTSVALLDSEVYGSLTGHNVKSRAHITRIIDCYIHDSAAREIDLVDEAGNTDVPGSDALLLGNIIVKAKNNESNHTVIMFGQDVGHDRNGTLYLVHNTIVTPFISPVVDLSAPHAQVRFVDNLIWDDGAYQKNQVLVKNRTGGQSLDLITGMNNFFCGGFGLQGGLGKSVAADEAPHFTDPARGDFTLTQSDRHITGKAAPIDQAEVPANLLEGLTPRPDNPDIGATKFSK
jgi:hypothetical protein